MSALMRSRVVAAVLLCLIVVGSLAVHVSLPQENRPGTDIYYNWVEGQRILAGENPYARILTSDMRVNQKYPTYFPLIYFLSSLTQQMGLRAYPDWLAVWRIIILGFNAAVGCFLYCVLYRRGGLLAAAFGALVWYLNRWNLQSSQAATYDVLPIFCLVVSLWILPRHRLTSFLLFSLSLAFKHLGALLVPLYLIYAWQSAATDDSRRKAIAWRGQAWAAVRDGLALASIPVLVSLPFFVWPGRTIAKNAEAFLKSIAFEVTRDSAQHLAAPSLDSLFGFWGAAARLPTLLLLLLVYGLFAQRRIGIFTASLLVMAVFIDFNSVLFLQYFCWMVPFVPLVILEVRDAVKTPLLPQEQRM